ncbi:MAG: hypothetical protein IJ722_02070 [Alloprevotella sp.]|nr:hypothetical protein [Alloprevotella sp.]
MKRTFFICFMALCGLSVSAQTAEAVTFRGVLAVLRQTVAHWNPAPADVVDASGLRLVFYSCYDEGEFDSSAIYYSRNANVMAEYDEESMCRKTEKTGSHACVLGIEAATSSGGDIRFSDKGDYDRFFREAVAYGLLQEEGGGEDTYYVTEEPLPGGKVRRVTNAELFAALTGESGAQYRRPEFMLTFEGRAADGWYVCSVGLDF